jgi:hypothetical protein
MEHVKESNNLPLILPPLSVMDVINDHVSNSLEAMFLLLQILRERGRDDFRQVFVFSNCEDFFLGQAT